LHRSPSNNRFKLLVCLVDVCHWYQFTQVHWMIKIGQVSLQINLRLNWWSLQDSLFFHSWIKFMRSVLLHTILINIIYLIIIMYFRIYRYFIFDIYIHLYKISKYQSNFLIIISCILIKSLELSWFIWWIFQFCFSIFTSEGFHIWIYCRYIIFPFEFLFSIII